MKTLEVDFLSAIFGERFDGYDLHQEVNGLTLRETLLNLIEGIEQNSKSGGPAFRTRCRRLVMLRFGFADGRRWTLREIGLEFGVGPERVRQMEARLLRILRHPHRSRFLKPFIKED
jgi:DNA-directed RNA polymerase sigma subunit (sigma70/sigma32)